MASHPPAECCTQGYLHEGYPVGEIKDFHGISTYFSYPANKNDSSKVILLLADAFGHKYTNTQLIADTLAAHGYFVVVPDEFNGDAIPPGNLKDFDLNQWLARHTAEITQPIIDVVYAAIKEELNPRKIGVVGYCFGAKYAIRLLNGKADAGYIAHPSFVSLDEVAAIKGPLSIAFAEIDSTTPTELRRQSEDKLAEIKATYECTLYGDVKHGFAVRGNDKDPLVKRSAVAAGRQMLNWFGDYLQISIEPTYNL